MIPTDPAYQLTDLIRLVRPLEVAFYQPSTTAHTDGAVGISGGSGPTSTPPCDMDTLDLLVLTDTLLNNKHIPPYLLSSAPYPPAVQSGTPLTLWYRSLPRVGQLELLLWVVTDEVAHLPGDLRDTITATWSTVRRELGLVGAGGLSLHEPMTLDEMHKATRLPLTTLKAIANTGGLTRWTVAGVDYYQIPQLTSMVDGHEH